MRAKARDNIYIYIYIYIHIRERRERELRGVCVCVCVRLREKMIIFSSFCFMTKINKVTSKIFPFKNVGSASVKH
jgi:hypothetical protein